jgi:two-component system, NarL family, response regulator DegU
MIESVNDMEPIMRTPNSAKSSHCPIVRALIVDDIPQVRQSLCELLELSKEIVVVGEAANGLDAIRQAEILRPDVIVMDLEMPEMDGCQATEIIKATNAAPKIIILTVHSGLDIEQRVQQSGAELLLQKGASYDTLMAAILNSEHN